MSQSNLVIRLLLCFATLTFIGTATAQAQACAPLPAHLPEPSDLPIIPTLPDPFTFRLSDRRVRSRADWPCRRAELLALAPSRVVDISGTAIDGAPGALSPPSPSVPQALSGAAPSPIPVRALALSWAGSYMPADPNAFGALLASAILDNMQGALGAAAWRWLFYIEGALTILVALLASFVLPDFPETTAAGGWLSAEEVALAVRRMRDDSGATARGASGGGGLANGFWMAVADPNVYILTAVLLSQSLANAFTMWFPTIVATLGYGRTATLLLCAPPYLLAAVLAFFVSRCASPSPLRSYSADHSTQPL